MCEENKRYVYSYQLIELENQKAKVNTDKQKDKIIIEVKKAYLDIEIAEKNIDLNRKNLEYAQENFKMAQLRYKEGITTSLELMSAEIALQQVQSKYIQSLNDYDVVVLQLIYSTGGKIE